MCLPFHNHPSRCWQRISGIVIRGRRNTCNTANTSCTLFFYISFDRRGAKNDPQHIEKIICNRATELFWACKHKKNMQPSFKCCCFGARQRIRKTCDGFCCVNPSRQTSPPSITIGARPKNNPKRTQTQERERESEHEALNSA